MRLPNAIFQITPQHDWQHRAAYPPLGFHPFTEGELGNGDSFGLYWPIGRERDEPLVVEAWHDEWRIQPFHSSLEGFLLAMASAGDEYPDPPLLAEDASSPWACHEVATQFIRARNTDAAISLLEKAVSVLPEYTDALTLLCGQYLRQGRKEEAARIAVQAIISPPSFGARPVNVLRWLCSPAAASLELDDPIWRARAQLKLVFGGLKENPDYGVMMDAINAYLARERFVQASTLMQTYAELMSGEGKAFQARHGFDGKAFLAWQIDVSAQLPGGPRSVVLR